MPPLNWTLEEEGTERVEIAGLKTNAKSEPHLQIRSQGR